MNEPLKRRDFLKIGGGALALGALAPAAFAEEPAAAPAKKRENKFGIMFATIPGNDSMMEKFKMVKDAGFAGVEVNGSYDRTEVLKARDATGLAIPSVCDGVHWLKPFTDANPATRAIAVEGLKTSLEDCKTYGGSSVLLVPGTVNKQTSYADAWTRAQEEIRKCVPLAEELGVKIAVENVWNHFLLSPLEAVRFVDEFKSPAVGWHFDVGNIIASGWPEQWMRILGKRIQKLHIKEYSRKKRDEEGLAKGFRVDYLEGDNDWPAVMKAMDDIEYRGWAIAEPAYHPPGKTTPEMLLNVREKMDKIFAM